MDQALYPRDADSSMQKYAHSQLDVNTKTPHYHDEFKVRLPSILTPQHHLLFTFFHVDLQMKLEAPKPVQQLFPLHLLSQYLWLEITLSCIFINLKDGLDFNSLYQTFTDFWLYGRLQWGTLFSRFYLLVSKFHDASPRQYDILNLWISIPSTICQYCKCSNSWLNSIIKIQNKLVQLVIFSALMWPDLNVLVTCQVVTINVQSNYLILTSKSMKQFKDSVVILCS